MAINKNHEFEELDSVKCAIVEKNASQQRVDFLKELLESNNFKVVVVPSAPSKAVAAAKPFEGEDPELPPLPATFTVGVTDVTFNPVNAVFGRLLKTPSGQVVTLAYWQQNEAVSNDEVPYFEKRHP